MTVRTARAYALTECPVALCKDPRLQVTLGDRSPVVCYALNGYERVCPQRHLPTRGQHVGVFGSLGRLRARQFAG